MLGFSITVIAMAVGVAAGMESDRFRASGKIGLALGLLPLAGSRLTTAFC
jgi:hypothetical protein